MSQKVLYPGSHEEAVELKKKYARTKGTEKMHLLYGGSPVTAKCRDCVHLKGRQSSHNCYKCELYRVTGGISTDWRAGNDACGKFKQKEIE